MEPVDTTNPYEAPRTSAVETGVAVLGSRFLATFESRASAARMLQWARIPNTVVSTASTLAAAPLRSGRHSVAGAEWPAVVRNAMGCVSLILMLAVLSTFLRWIHSAARVSQTRAADAAHGSTSATLSWFVPVANLVWPYLVMRQLWLVARNGAEWRRGSTPPTLVAWGVLWFLWNAWMLAVIALLGLVPSGVNTFVNVTIAVFDIATSVYLAYFIREVTNGLLQRRSRAH